jgi:uncharacterized cofD-like protein
MKLEIRKLKIMSKKRVVAVGGGNGSAIALEALKQHRDIFDISAVISMSDSGGSSGRLRREFGTLPPGDILRAILSLSLYDYSILRKIFYNNRFSGAGKSVDHNLGNLFFSSAVIFFAAVIFLPAVYILTYFFKTEIFVTKEIVKSDRKSVV